MDCPPENSIIDRQRVGEITELDYDELKSRYER